MAILFNDGTVETSGLSTLSFADSSAVASELTDIVDIMCPYYACGALKSDGSVVTWGEADRGGTNPGGLTNVSSLYGSLQAMAALKNDGSAVAWGVYSYGGDTSYSLNGDVSSDVVSIHTWVRADEHHGAYLAIKSDGSLAAWGQSSGANIPTEAQLE